MVLKLKLMFFLNFFVSIKFKLSAPFRRQKGVDQLIVKVSPLRSVLKWNDGIVFCVLMLMGLLV